MSKSKSKSNGWMKMVCGIMRIQHVSPLLKVLKESKNTMPDIKSTLRSVIAVRGTQIDNRRALYQAIMHVSYNCPYNEVVTFANRDKMNVTKHVKYDIALQAMLTEMPEYFNGNIAPDMRSVSMMEKWELFRQGYMTAYDTIIRQPYLVPTGKDVPPKVYKTMVEAAQREFIAERNSKSDIVVRL